LRCDRSQQQYFEDIFVTPHGSGDNSTSRTTFVAVVSMVNFAAIQPIVGDAAAGMTKTSFRVTTGGQLQAFKTAYVAGSVPANTPVVIAAALPTGLNRFYSCIDGVYASNGFGSAFFSSAAVTTAQFLRTSTSGTPSYFHGDIYEFMQFDEQLTQRNMTQVVESLMLKYGIT
jgi:hypothetical protein